MNQTGLIPADSPKAINPALIGAIIPDLTLATTIRNSIDPQTVAIEKPTVFFFPRDGWRSHRNKQKVNNKNVNYFVNPNINFEQASGEKHLLPVPSVFIIDTDGMIKCEYVNPNHKVRLKLELLLAIAKATLEPTKE